MSRVLLARHASHVEVGRVLSGRSEIALSKRGRGEAERLAWLFEERPLDAIYSSPRRRALETAAPLADAMGLEVATAPALDEIDFGAFAGRSFAQLDADPDWQRWNAQRASFRAPGGETMAEAAQRAWGFLRPFAERDEAVLCVSHCDVIRALVADVLGLSYDRLFAFDCDPASVTELDLTPGGARLVSLNVTTG